MTLCDLVYLCSEGKEKKFRWDGGRDGGRRKEGRKGRVNGGRKGEREGGMREELRKGGRGRERGEGGTERGMLHPSHRNLWTCCYIIHCVK